MNFDSGIAPGVPRSAVLRFSAPPCIDVLDDNHAVMVISFDQDAKSCTLRLDWENTRVSADIHEK